MAKGVFKKLGRFEVHHRIAFFFIILVGTIIIFRLLGMIYNPNPALLHLEVHHFDYGILLVLISSQLLLFGSQKFNYVYLLLTAIASGLIIDEYWFIRRNVIESVDSIQYNSTFPSVLILILMSILIALFISSILKSKSKKDDR